ncbi:MAG: IS200/IS605 family transposase [Pyrinomonadaceae bacterium]
MSQSFTNLLYHIIFSTKDRQPLITSAYEPRLYDYIGGIIKNTGGVSLGINGAEDHVHVLAKLRPDKALSAVLRDLKCNAGGWMHNVFPEVEDFSWQRGYAAFTLSQSHVKAVQKYLERQKEHHQKISFRDEFIRFLTVNGIEFDERFV